MDPEVEERFRRTESLLHAMAERENQIEKRFTERMDRAFDRLDKADQRADKADQRMDKFDRRLEAIGKLIQTGMKLLVRNSEKIEDLAGTVKALAKKQDAFIDSLRRGGNGNGHRKPAA